MEQPFRCPVCQSSTVALWEHTDEDLERWFAGAYLCERCGQIGASGGIVGHSRVVRSWQPPCPVHGVRGIIRTMQAHCYDQFVCTAPGCDCVIERDGMTLTVSIGGSDDVQVRARAV